MELNRLPNVDPLRKLDCIVDLDAEVATVLSILNAPETELNGPAVDQRRLRAP